MYHRYFVPISRQVNHCVSTLVERGFILERRATDFYDYLH